MLMLKNVEIDGVIDSFSGKIEFLVLYGRIESLIKYYNFNQSNYEDFIKDKKNKLGNFRIEINDPIHRTFKDNLLGEITFTKEELTMDLEDELYSIEIDFLEFQKMTLIILCYSEIEKFFDNIIEITIGKNVKSHNLKEKILKLNDFLKIDLIKLISSVDTLRKIRNNIVHNYDYWDSEIIIFREGKKNNINGLKDLNDEILSNIINIIVERLNEFEILFNNKGY